MSSRNQQNQQEGLVLGDRLNWPYIIGNAVMNYHSSIVKVEGEQSEQEVRESALVIRYSMPGAWTKADVEFKQDLSEAVIKRLVDNRKEWCGHKVGPKIFEGPGKNQIEEEIIDPYKLYYACVNVFNRRGLLSKTIFTEKIVPEPSDFEEDKKEKDKDEE